MNGKYEQLGGMGATLRDLQRSAERAAAGDEPTGGPILHRGPDAPTDGSVFWWDTDGTC